MTEHDLATLVRHHVSPEPPFAGTPGDVLAQGRRTVRRRRATAGVAGATVLAIAAFALPRPGGDDARPDRVVDPAITQALAEYDALSMPSTMDERARAVLGASVPDLGPADFVAYDDQAQRLPERYWEKASGLTTRYGGDSGHRVTVTLQHSRSSAEGDPERYCAESPYLECAVDTTDAGDVVITTFGAMRPMAGPDGSSLQAWQENFMAVTAEELDGVRPDRLWFSRAVKVIKSETFVTWTSEVVRAPDPASARALLAVPAEDLAAIGLDPALVMPPPPPGDGNGCPQWTMETEDMQVSCTDADGAPLVD